MQLSFCTGLFRAVPDYTLYYIPETARDNRKWRVAVASHDYNGNDGKMTMMTRESGVANILACQLSLSSSVNEEERLIVDRRLVAHMNPC